MKLTDGQADFVAYIEGTLIPDLREGGRDCTADDFETLLRIIADLQLRAGGES